MRTLTEAEAREAFAEIDGRNYSSVVLRNYFGTGRTVMQARVGHCGGTDYSDLGLVDDKTAKSLIALGATDWRS